MITADQVLTHKNDIEGKARTAKALNMFVEGEKSLADIACELGIDRTAIYYLIKKNISLIEADKSFNKAIRVNRLQRLFNNIPDELAPRTIDDVVKLSSELRKEIEGEKNTLVDNRQVNIYVSNSKDSEQILPALGAEENLHESKEV